MASRRQCIKGIGGSALVASIAGCSQSEGNESPTDTDASGGGSSSADSDTSNGTAESSSALSYPPPESGASGLLFEVIDDDGIDESHNLDMSYQYASVPAGEQLFINNKTETGHLSVLGNVRANASGSEIRQLWPLMRNNESLVVNPDAGVPSDGSLSEVMESIGDLTIGSLGESSMVYSLFGVIAYEAGYGDVFENIDFRFGAPAAIRGLAQKGELDGIINFAPHTTALIANHDFDKVIDYPAAWNELTGTSISQNGVCVHQSVLDEKPEAIRRFRDTYFEVSNQVQNNIESTFNEYVDFLDVSQDTLPTLIENAQETEWFPPEFDGSIREGERQFTRLAYEHGFLEDEPDLDQMFVDYNDL